jgi:hypothetical protein
MTAILFIFLPPFLVGVVLAVAHAKRPSKLPALARAAAMVTLGGVVIGAVQASTICGRGPVGMILDSGSNCLHASDTPGEGLGALVLLSIALAGLGYVSVRAALAFGKWRSK